MDKGFPIVKWIPQTVARRHGAVSKSYFFYTQIMHVDNSWLNKSSNDSHKHRKVLTVPWLWGHRRKPQGPPAKIRAGTLPEIPSSNLSMSMWVALYLFMRPLKKQYTKNVSEFLPRIAVCGKCKIWNVHTSKINKYQNSKINKDNLRVERASGIAVRNWELTPCSDDKGLRKTVSVTLLVKNWLLAEVNELY